MNFLVVEDDIGINRGIKINLEMDKHEVFTAFSLKEARKIFDKENIEFIILDVNLPDGSGFDFCKQIREKSEIPIIFLTACDLETDQVIGFSLGGDDYVTKPFSIAILKQRIYSILKRYTKSKKTDLIKSGVFTLNLDSLTIDKNGEKLLLSQTEYKLLKFFIENKGKILTRDKILEYLWANDSEYIEEHAITVNINRLRGKIEENSKKPKYLKTAYGLGYIWSDKL